MSQKTVQLFIGRVLTDEDLRQQFLEDPRGMLTMFRDQGFELTSGEIESLVQTEKALWTDAAERIPPACNAAASTASSILSDRRRRRVLSEEHVGRW
jgi:hypothetical protein